MFWPFYCPTTTLLVIQDTRLTDSFYKFLILIPFITWLGISRSFKFPWVIILQLKRNIIIKHKILGADYGWVSQSKLYNVFQLAAFFRKNFKQIQWRRHIHFRCLWPRNDWFSANFSINTHHVKNKNKTKK